MGFFGKIKDWFGKGKSWLKDRFSEPSSWTALGGLFGMVGIVADIEEAPAIVKAIVENADALAGGSYTATGLQILGSLMFAKGFIKPEKFND